MRLVLLTVLFFSTSALAVGPLARSSNRTADPAVDKTIREVAGSAEYLRSVPKRFGILQAVDAEKASVRLLFDGDTRASDWPLLPDAEVKIDGWWGRLEQLQPGERLWAWLQTDRKKNPVAIAMLADELSHQDIQGPGVVIKKITADTLVLKRSSKVEQTLSLAGTSAWKGATKADPTQFSDKDPAFVKTRDGKATLLLDTAAFELRRQRQKSHLREVWLKHGLPGSVGFVHVFSGEADVLLDHEAMRWGRSLQRGDKVTIQVAPPITAVVKSVQPWRERTSVRLVAKAQDLSDLRAGQRIHLRMPAPSAAVENDRFPPDLGKQRSREERVEWFLASIYCTCGVRGDTCTGHFYTLSSCNPNGCAMPKQMRKTLGGLIDEGLTDRQILERLLKEQGPGLLQPHLLP